MYNFFKKINIGNKQGFSLVEMLVAVGIFMSIMTISVTSLISIIGANKKAQSIKSTIDSVTFAVENISRDMREGSDYQCSIDAGKSFGKDCLTGGNAVRYVNVSGKLVTYIFNGLSTDSSLGVITKTIDTSSPVDLISQDSNVNITNMKFYVIGADCEIGGALCPSGRTQPRVVITVSGLISVKGSNDTSFNLQTSVSQRTRKI